jgi:hypothetical protein
MTGYPSFVADIASGLELPISAFTALASASAISS